MSRVVVVFGLGILCIGAVAVARGDRDAAAAQSPAPLGPLPPLSVEPDPRRAALGERLFFEKRLGGDASISCATCHDPNQGWADGLPLSRGYPGNLYFRNAPTVLNVAHGGFLYWDGRLPASDLPTIVRDHLSEAHFMQNDGRVVIERLRQIPAYEEGFREAFGGEPTYGRILETIADYLRTLRSRDVPFDRYIQGDTDVLSPEARRGLETFRGKANCISCHHGPMFSDGGFHNLGLEANREIFRSPRRHVTFRRFFRTLGVSEYSLLREDVGLYAITKEEGDRGRFRTPTLREISHTAPYMHDGSLETLEAVVDFYDRGGGPGSRKSPRLGPLDLSEREKRDLVEFLRSLSGAPIRPEVVEPPEYDLRSLGENE